MPLNTKPSHSFFPGLSSYPYLPPKLSLFQSPENGITNTAKPKRQWKSNIASKHGIANEFANRAGEPYLGHPHDSAEDSKAEGEDCSDARGKQARILIYSEVIPAEAAFEEKVLYEGNAFVDGEPVTLEERLSVSGLVRSMLSFSFFGICSKRIRNQEGCQERDAW